MPADQAYLRRFAIRLPHLQPRAGFHRQLLEHDCATAMVIPQTLFRV